MAILPDQRLRVAVVGAGIGREHVHGYTELPDLFTVGAICDLDEARASEVASRAPGSVVATDLNAVLADPAIDIIDICLPPHLHYDAAVQAIEAGKHVICEKPLVTSLADADTLIERIDATDRKLFPVFQYRFGDGFRKLLRLIDSGTAGRPLVATLETHWNRGADYYAVPWRGTWDGEQGGAILGHAIHIHDLVCAALGPVHRVSAMTATRVNPIEIEDCAALVFEMANGALVTSSVTLGAADDMSRLRFCFAKVTAESALSPYNPGSRDWTFTARTPSDQVEIEDVIANFSGGPERFAGMFEEVYKSLRGAPSQVVEVSDARRSIELVTAIYASAQSGSAELLPIGSNHSLYHGWHPKSGN